MILDLDGTLVRLLVPWGVWIQGVMNMLPVDERGALRRALEVPGAAWGTEYNRLLDSGALVHEAVVSLSQNFEASWFAYEPNPRLVAKLPEIAAQNYLSLWTNNTRATAARIIDELGVADNFTRIVSIEDVKRGKPHPDGWRLLSDLAEPSETLIVGDSDNDSLLAEAIGCRFAMVEW